VIENLQAHYGFTRTPFGRSLAPGMLHRHGAHAEAVARIGWCVTERALGVITGEVGAGKTVAVRAALASLDSSRHTVIYLGNPAVGGRGLYAGIVSALGGVPRFHKAALIPQTVELLAAVLNQTDPHAARALHAGGGDTPRTTVLAHRLGASIEQYLLARRQLAEAVIDRVDDDPVTVFTPAVELNAGFLPGSIPVSSAASMTPGRGGPLDRAAMAPHVRASIQVAVAAAIAVTVGDLVSGPRLYWAVLATFLAFMATTNSGEQVRRALFRVAGTAIGIVAGDLLVHLTGGRVWVSLLIVLVALFFGIYLIRVNYTFMVIGITVTVTQLYAQLGEFSWQLLLLRLGETAIGVGAVVLTVLVILPLRPQRVLTTGVLLWFRALTTLLDGALHRLLSGEPVPLRPAVRQLDAAYAALEATAAPLRSTTFGRNAAQLNEIRVVTAAARNYARSFATQADATETTDGLNSPAMREAARQLRASAEAIEHRIDTGEDGTYTRASALLELASRPLTPGDTPARLALRDLTLLDGALARLATALHMDLRDHDTTVADPTPSATAATAPIHPGSSR
jgi:uncharacterized membrane protein YgaE (UPF0421/DUF939 family)